MFPKDPVVCRDINRPKADHLSTNSHVKQTFRTIPGSSLADKILHVFHNKTEVQK